MLDFLAITAHPDDESAISGLFLLAKQQGYSTGLICLTQGESGGFATREQRIEEFEKATQILGLDYVKLLDFPDAGLEADVQSMERLIDMLRECEAKVVLTIHPDDYHPDHRAVYALVDRALFVSGLNKYSTDNKTYHPSQFLTFSLDPKRNKNNPDIVLDISSVEKTWEQVIKSYASQEIFHILKLRAQYLGLAGGFSLGEGLYCPQMLRLGDVSSLLNNSKSGR